MTVDQEPKQVKVQCPSCDEKNHVEKTMAFQNVSCSNCEKNFILPEPFGQYLLLDIIANDECTSTHHAMHGEHKIVLRRLRSDYKDSEALHNIFLEVMKQLQAFKGDSVVKIESVGEVGSLPYVEFEHYGVTSLKSKLSKKRFSLLEGSYLILDILSSFEMSFSQSFVHGNIKPSNIRFDEHDNIRLFDFGLSMALTKELMKEQISLNFYNNPHYIAPETIARGELTPFSDLYSLGAVFYEILTGKKPFGKLGGPGAMHAKLDESPEAMNHLVPGIPPKLNKLIMGMLEINSLKRPQFIDQIIPVLQESIEEIEKKETEESHQDLGQTQVADIGYVTSDLSKDALLAMEAPVVDNSEQENLKKLSEMSLLGVLFFVVILLAVLYLGLK